jgi:putative ABC transport system substrate-binding protein
MVGNVGRLKSLQIVNLLLILILPVPSEAGGKTIGVIMTGDIAYFNSIHSAFVDELSAHGFTAADINIAVQKPAPQTMAWTNAARRFAVLGVDVIVSYGAASTVRVIKETSKIPIVFAGVPDPSALGISGANVTGVGTKLPLSAIVKYLKAISHSSTLGVVYSSIERDTVKQLEKVKGAAAEIGFGTVGFDVNKGCRNISFSKVGALLITTSSSAVMCTDRIVQAARKHKITSAAVISGGEDKGVILSVYGDPVTQGREAAKIVAQVIEGTDPSMIPVHVSSKTQMTINVGEAKAIGVQIPLELLAAATRLIK